MKLSEESEELLQRILIANTQETREKFRKGAEEHGDNLPRMSAEALLEEALGEVVDLAVYLRTALEKVRKECA